MKPRRTDNARRIGQLHKRIRARSKPAKVRLRRSHVPNLACAGSPLRTMYGVPTKHAIGTLLKSLLAQQGYLPANAQPLLSADDLPLCLRARVKHIGALASWHAWTDAVRIWFTVARLRVDSDERRRPLCLEVHFFDSNGNEVAAGRWTLRPSGFWSLCCVMDVVTRTHEEPQQTAHHLKHISL